MYFSIPFANNEMARKVEPQAPSITKRFEAMSQLSQAGIPTAISIAPVIPGLNEQDIPNLLHQARQAGATEATYILLRLNGNVEQVFLERMKHHFPERLSKISNQLRQMRKGKLSEQAFFQRHRGQGATWETVEQLFNLNYKKAGYPLLAESPIPNSFRRPGPSQLPLFINS